MIQKINNDTTKMFKKNKNKKNLGKKCSMLKDFNFS